MSCSETQKLIKHLSSTVALANLHSVALLSPKIDLKNKKLVRYYDASFANSHYKKIKLRKVIRLCDGCQKSVQLLFKSNLARISYVLCSCCGSIAFTDASMIDLLFFSKWKSILGRNSSRTLLIDRKFLFDIIHGRSLPSVKHVMLFIASLRQGFKNNEINNMFSVRSFLNVFHELTKKPSQ